MPTVLNVAQNWRQTKKHRRLLFITRRKMRKSYRGRHRNPKSTTIQTLHLVRSYRSFLLYLPTKSGKPDCRSKRSFSEESGKISAQPHPTLCIQFLNRGNNDKNNTFPLGKQIYFTIVWGCAETLPLSFNRGDFNNVKEN